MTMSYRIYVLSLALLLAGCGAPYIGDARGPESALVFGHISVPRRLSHVYLYELGKAYIGTLNMPRATVYRNGNFVFTNLKPGKYYIAGFADRTNTFWLTYNDASLERALIDVAPGKLVFAGSYTVTNVESQWLVRHPPLPSAQRARNPGATCAAGARHRLGDPHGGAAQGTALRSRPTSLGRTVRR